MSSRLLREITSSKEEVRHEAYEKALKFPSEKSLPILRKGLRHWDRKLRNKCALSIIEIIGTKAASLVFPLYAKGLLFASSSVDKLRQREDDTLIKYMMRKKGTKDDLAKIASQFYVTTQHYKKKEAEKEAILNPKKKKAEKGAILNSEAYNSTQPDYQDIVHFFSDLTPAGHALFLYSEWSLKNGFDSLYKVSHIPKKSGGKRQIEEPHPVLKMAQRLFLNKLAEKVRLHDNCHGFRTGKSIISNATPHVGKEVVVNLDLKDFFPTISSKRVYGILKKIGYKGQELRFLTDMTIFNSRLPQGAPTSPMLANISCIRLDNRLTGLAKKLGANYTRYADDITFSGQENVVRCIPVIKNIIEAEGFGVALPKLRIHRKGARQEVTGLTVNKQVSVPRAIRRRLRATVHGVKNGKEPNWKGQPLSMQSLKGHLYYHASIHPEQAQKMLKALP